MNEKAGQGARREVIMKKSGIFTVILGCFTACMLFVHRRVIRAVMKGEEIPQAPAWHCWVKNRKGGEAAEADPAPDTEEEME